ncbi:UbiA family prenyltransferase [Nesterenkonia sp. CF4.4]|uniref:UbiA family prenyltransferase n=1 Tax=Nesterenkonia sp. CF4.4 TaxID=3373079 RepID=UPI003EE696FC
MTILTVTRGLWGSSHPGPTVVVTVLAAALAVSTGLAVERIALLAAAVFLGQLSVGISNDAFDAERDRAVGRTDKPIARGDLSVRAAWAAAIGCLVLALLLSAPLGLGVLGAHAVFLAASWAYNAGLKATVFSLAPFLLAFGLFPSIATLAAPDAAFAAGWAWFAGAALGAAIHLTNVLPDLDDDARTGITGLPHRLGARPSAALAATAVLAGGVAVTAGAAEWQLQQVPLVSWVFFVLVSAVALLSLGMALRARSGRVLFRLVMLAALLLAAQLVVAGGSLAG